MKYKLTILIAILLSSCMISFAGGRSCAPKPDLPDSAVLAELDRTLYESLDQMAAAKTFERQYQEIEEFLGAVTDSATRQHLALKCYDYYIHSKLNGTEAVAIMMVDSLFATHRIRMNNDIELLNARVYADFNRKTLLGNEAPSLVLYDKDRKAYDFPVSSADRYSAIYFYSADCPKCKIETAMLKRMLEQENPAIRLYAIYTDDNFEHWQKYVTEDFDIDASKVEIIHLWDPEYESDFRKEYAVLQTPKMFFLDKNNVILGRSLDTFALQQLIHGIEELHPYVYGSEEADKSYDRLFKNFQPEVALEDIKFLLAYSEKLFPAGDPQFKYMIGDLMYYLCRNRYKGSAYLQGAEYIVDSLVQKNPQMWTLQSDSLQVLGFAEYVKDLSSILPLGSTVPSMRFKAEMKSPGMSKTRRWKLDALGMPAYVVLYTDDCSNCRDALSSIDEFMAMVKTDDEGAEKLNFLLVNVGRIEKSHPRRFRKILERFDLSFMPFIFQLDASGKVIDKYI